MTEQLPRLCGLTGVQGLMAVLSIDDVAGERSPGRLLRRINALLKSRIQGRFVDPDLNAVQWIASELVHDGVVTNAGELARSIDFTTGTTTRLIDGLEGSGFVLRDHNAIDRRVVRLILTPAGEAKYAQKAPVMVEGWNELLADFETEEVHEMIRLLTKLLRAMELSAAHRGIIASRKA
ncbi:MarR family transcriptional regulator [Paraburkholderia sediminicola]|uniref:MarR family winged helix-turn-helix transcriptional regulator n=1 Tax=Paraburkholderia sediminicola TaxID=458836 RepID=UPI0038B937E7